MYWTLVAGLAVVLSAPSHAQQRTGLAAAADAMGAASLNSIEFTGSGNVFSFGQAFEPGERWPRFIQRTYSAAINYQTPAMRLVQVRSQASTLRRAAGPGGRGGPAHRFGRRRQIRLQEAGAQATPNPALPAIASTSCGRHRTRHQAAIANAARVEGNAAIFTLDGREFKATLNAQNLIEKVSYLSTMRWSAIMRSKWPIRTMQTSAASNSRGTSCRRRTATRPWTLRSAT